MVDKAPLYFAGAISLIYAGAITEAAPTANPPIMRNIINTENALAIPEPQAETTNKIAEITNILLLPYLSAKRPAKKAPIAHPNSIEATLKQLLTSWELNAISNPLTVPLITPLSKPKSKFNQ